MSLNGENSVAEGDAASSSKQEICFVCDDNTAGRRNSSLSLNHSSEELNTFLIPHLPHSNAVPCPSNPQMFPPEDEEMESVTDDAVASRQVGATASRSLEGVTSPSLQHPYRSITYFSGNPAVVITRGIIQIFKSNNKVHVDEDKFLPHTDTLIMLAVPASVNAHGVIEFTSAFCDCIIRMQIIRDRTPNQYMVLLKFASPADAFNCYMSLNNQPYRSDLGDEICHLAFVASVEVLPAIGSDKNQSSSVVVENQQAPAIPPHTTELPDCMVCLERMDESVRGVLTILCNHSFHAACLQQWEDLCCPVCRYIQTPEPYSHNKCQTCGALEDLWICLICGNVGCGRYTSEHAQQHYSETYHNFAMSLNDDRVWDYVGDYFVHRLNQKDDGKLVEKKDGTDESRDNKVFDIQLECMHLLSTQLESQRKYWEERILEVERKQESRHQELLTRQRDTEKTVDELHTQVEVLGKEKRSLTQRNTQLGSKFREALKDLGVERELNKGLLENQNAWKEKVEVLEREKGAQQKEIVDLKEQLRDMMFYIEATKLIDSESTDNKDEIRDGKIVVGEASTSGKKRAHRARKNR